MVSILLPYYNDKDFLAESIRSVLAQTYRDFELVLVNHASTDGSRDIAHGFADSRIVHVDMAENNGAGGGLVMTEFLKATHAGGGGGYLKFFCADDILLPNGLAELVRYMDQHPEKDFAFGNLHYINAKGSSLKADWFSTRKGFSLDNTEEDCIRLFAEGKSIFPWVGSIVRMEKMRGVHLDSTLVMMFDMSIWLQLLLMGCRVGYVTQPVANYRLHDGQQSGMSHYQECIAISSRECGVYERVVFGCQDVDLVRRCFPSRYSTALRDPQDIPFIIAVHLLQEGSLSPVPYEYLHDMLENETTRARIRERFAFTIADFRKLAKLTEPLSGRRHSRFVRWKKSLLRSKATELSFLESAWLFADRLGRLLSFRSGFRDRPIVGNGYSL